MVKKLLAVERMCGVVISGIALLGLAGGSFAADPQAAKPAKPPSSTRATKSPSTAASASRTNTTSSSVDEANQKIIEFVRAAALSLSPTVEMSVVSRLPSKFGNLETVTVSISDGTNTFRQEILATPDNKYAFIPGRIFDLAADPFAETMSHITTSNCPSRGNPNAKVTVVEYSDFECPVCGRAYKTVENEVMKEYGDRIRFVYKNFPLPNHPWAQSASIAAMCAYAQSPAAFWTFYRGFFDNQSSITKDTVRGSAMTLARDAKLDMTKFQQCYDQKQSLDRINADLQEGSALGIPGTPLFLVNGRPISGAQPFSAFKMVIDEAMKKAAE